MQIPVISKRLCRNLVGSCTSKLMLNSCMSKPAFFTQPLIHVTGHNGSLSVFLAALIYHAVNPDVPAPPPNRYDYTWFGNQAKIGGYYAEWFEACHAMDQLPSDQINAAYHATADWVDSGHHRVIESSRSTANVNELFGSHKQITLYAQEEDRYQLAYNYIMLDCVARQWSGFEQIIDSWNQCRETVLTKDELYELFTRATHLDDPVVKEIIKIVGDSLSVPTFDPDDDLVPGALNLFYSQYANVDFAENTVAQIVDYLGNLVVVQPEDLTKTLQAFLRTIQPVGYMSFLP